MAQEIQPTPRTEALDELDAWMAAEPKRRTRAFVGKSVGTSGQSVSQWFALKSRPAPRFQSRIRALTGIEEYKWLTAEEREAEALALANAATAQVAARA